MLARIAALRRQAEGTDYPHEAEAFMAAAPRLATVTSEIAAQPWAPYVNKTAIDHATAELT